MKSKEYYWMEVDNKNAELPMAVAESAAELAQMVGVHPTYVTNSVYGREKLGKRNRFIRVEKEQTE